MLEELGLVIGCLVAALIASQAWAYARRRITVRRSLVNHIEFFKKNVGHDIGADMGKPRDTNEKDAENETSETIEHQRELLLRVQTRLPRSVLGFGEPEESITATEELRKELKPVKKETSIPTRKETLVTAAPKGGSSLRKSIGKSASEKYETEVKNDKESKEAARKAKEERAKELAEKKEAEKKEAASGKTKTSASGVSGGFSFNFQAPKKEEPAADKK